ncbi:MAG: hypothetical protein LBB74_10630 [Chitinispirillales bacterium]|jgi:hypothetical protein|nr:hypothetical protein [Chitinispirillales bacterium]
MRKINFIFAAVFAVAMLVGGVNMFTAANADVGKKGVAVDDVAASVAKQLGYLGVSQSGAVVKQDSTDTVDKKSINLVRRGRKIQVDGFLLEWRGAEANVWPEAKWLWDAVSTVEGVAGYVSLPAGGVDTGINTGSNPGIDAVDNAAAVNNDTGIDMSYRRDWIFTLRAVNTGRSLEIKLPGRPSGEFFAFDKGEFDAGGPLTAEWVVPWEFFDDGDDSDGYKLSISATGGGGALRPLVLTVEVPREPRAPSGLLTRLAMLVLIAALTVTLVVIRRRQMREKRLI